MCSMMKATNTANINIAQNAANPIRAFSVILNALIIMVKIP